jgi:hypothetical protein
MPGKSYYLTTLAAWQRHAHRFASSHWIALGEGNSPQSDDSPKPTPHESGDSTPILALIEADEGAHLALESDADFQPLPHPLAQKPIPVVAQSAIVARGIAIPDRATTFEAAESLARVHPLLRHRVF